MHAGTTEGENYSVMVATADTQKNGVCVLVVEDYAPMRAATCTRLRSQPDVGAVGEASNATEALSFIEGFNPLIVLLDVRLAGTAQDGIGLAGELRRRFPGVRIILYSALLADQLADLLRAPNVWGYVCKTDPPGLVVEAVRAVAKGDRYGLQRPAGSEPAPVR